VRGSPIEARQQLAGTGRDHGPLIVLARKRFHRIDVDELGNRYEQAPDADRAFETAFRSSPVAYVSGWKSPVLLIHGDDDRNVRFGQTVDLVQRLDAAGVPYEELIIPDDTHHFMRHANSVRADAAVGEFLARKLRVAESR